MFEEIERETMSKALQLAAESSVMMGVIGGLFAYSTHLVFDYVVAAAVGIVFAVVVAHRWVTSRRGQHMVNDVAARKRTAFQMDLNQHALSVFFTLYGFVLYPHLPMPVQSCYLAVCIGSIAIGTAFMPFIGKSFAPVLAIRGITLAWALRDVPWMSAASIVFLVSMYRSGGWHVKTSRAAIFHKLKAQRVIAELAQRNKEIEAISDARADLVAHVTHEIRSPLSGILNAIQLLDDQPTTADRPELITNARNAGEHLMLVIGDILDNAKMTQQGDLDITYAPTSIKSMLDLCASIVRLRAENKGLDFQVEFSGGEDQAVMADSRRISQILLNLLSNAIKYTDEGGSVRLHAHQIAEHDDELTVYFRVQDTGAGIDPSLQQEIFTEFNTVRTKSAKQRYGSGLGLFISQRIAKAMNSEIQLQSTLGHGSIFTFRMDFDIADTTEVEPVHEVQVIRHENDCGQMGCPRALVVDDHEINRNISARTLNMLGYEVVTAVSGEEALRLHIANPFDLVLMDYRMPGMPGSRAGRLLRDHDTKQNRQCKLVIIATTADTTANFGTTSDGGDVANGYLIKPFTRQELVATVRRLTPPLQIEGPRKLTAQAA